MGLKPPDIISRPDWRAQYQDGYAAAPLPARYTVLHHSATIAPNILPPFDDDNTAVRTLERICQERFGTGMSYTFAFTPVGRIYEGVSINRASAHTLGHNFDARAFCMIGNYQTTHPSEAMLRAIASVLGWGWLHHYWQDPHISGGHRDMTDPGHTECPGNAGENALGKIRRYTDEYLRGDEMSAEDSARLARLEVNLQTLRNELHDIGSRVRTGGVFAFGETGTNPVYMLIGESRMQIRSPNDMLILGVEFDEVHWLPSNHPLLKLPLTTLEPPA